MIHKEHLKKSLRREEAARKNLNTKMKVESTRFCVEPASMKFKTAKKKMEF